MIAMTLTIAVFVAVMLSQIERRIHREAQLLISVEMAALKESIDSPTPPGISRHTWIREFAERSVREAERDLDLGIQIFNADAELMLATGSLANTSLPLARALVDGRRDMTFRSVNLGKTHAHLAMGVPLRVGFLQIAMGTQRYAGNLQDIRRTFFLAIPMVLVVTALAGWILARRSLRPIREIRDSAERIRAGDLSDSIAVSGNGDELDRMARTLNEMLSRLRAGNESAHRFNENAAHQLRTPLTRLRNVAEVTLSRPRNADEYREVLEALARELKLFGNDIDSLLRLAKMEAGLVAAQKVRVEVDDLFQTTCEFFGPLAAERGIRLVRSPAEATVLGEPSWLNQMLANLVDNAIEHTGPGGEIHLEADLERDWVHVFVRDTGSGIPAEDHDRIFDRFSRGENAQNRGFGMGLPIAHEIARAHDGRLELVKSGSDGSVFRVRLPLVAEAK